VAATLTGLIGDYRATTRVLTIMAEDHILSGKLSKTTYSILFIMVISAAACPVAISRTVVYNARMQGGVVMQETIRRSRARLAILLLIVVAIVVVTLISLLSGPHLLLMNVETSELYGQWSAQDGDTLTLTRESSVQTYVLRDKQFLTENGEPVRTVILPAAGCTMTFRGETVSLEELCAPEQSIQFLYR